MSSGVTGVVQSLDYPGTTVISLGFSFIMFAAWYLRHQACPLLAAACAWKETPGVTENSILSDQKGQLASMTRVLKC